MQTASPYLLIRFSNENAVIDAQVGWSADGRTFAVEKQNGHAVLPGDPHALADMTPRQLAGSLCETLVDQAKDEEPFVRERAAMAVPLPDEDATVGPIPVGGGGRKPEAELDRLSNILKTFNDQFGTLFTDADRIIKCIHEDIAPKVGADAAYLNARSNTPDAARVELDAALMRVINPLLRDDTEFYKQFVQNESFKRFVTETVRGLTAS